jgi:hypothetical protein
MSQAEPVLQLVALAEGPSRMVWQFDARESQAILNLLVEARASGVLSIPFHNGAPRGKLRFEQRDIECS